MNFSAHPHNIVIVFSNDSSKDYWAVKYDSSKDHHRMNLSFSAHHHNIVIVFSNDSSKDHWAVKYVDSFSIH